MDAGMGTEKHYWGLLSQRVSQIYPKSRSRSSPLVHQVPVLDVPANLAPKIQLLLFFQPPLGHLTV